MKRKTKTPAKVYALLHEPRCRWTADVGLVATLKDARELYAVFCRPVGDFDGRLACRIVAYVPEKKDK